MIRSPLFYPMNRGMDADGGGVADLQTDVMRFMAILALCLVAIFALVQSIPLTPAVQAPAVAPPAPPVEATPAPEPAPLTEPEPLPEPVPEPEPESLAEPEPAPVPEPSPEPDPIPEPQTQAMPAPPQDTPPIREGFTLRFETDLALTRLVARNEVGLYAITPDRSLRMSVNRGQISFWNASAPNQFHEMDTATVPDEVVAALRRAGALQSTDAVQWGVTLPATMRRQLNQYLAEHSGGELIIDPDGTLRFE